MNLFISALILHTICLIAIPIELVVHIAYFSGLGRLQQSGRQKGSQKGTESFSEDFVDYNSSALSS